MTERRGDDDVTHRDRLASLRAPRRLLCLTSPTRMRFDETFERQAVSGEERLARLLARRDGFAYVAKRRREFPRSSSAAARRREAMTSRSRRRAPPRAQQVVRRRASSVRSVCIQKALGDGDERLIEHAAIDRRLLERERLSKCRGRRLPSTVSAESFEVSASAAKASSPSSTASSNARSAWRIPSAKPS